MRTVNYDKYKIIFIDSCVCVCVCIPVLFNQRNSGATRCSFSFFTKYIYFVSNFVPLFRGKEKDHDTIEENEEKDNSSLFLFFRWRSRSSYTRNVGREKRKFGRRLARRRVWTMPRRREVIRGGLSPWRPVCTRVHRPLS